MVKGETVSDDARDQLLRREILMRLELLREIVATAPDAGDRRKAERLVHDLKAELAALDAAGATPGSHA